MPGVTLYQGVVGLKAGTGDGHGQLLMVDLLDRDDFCVGEEVGVDPEVEEQVGLELIQVHGEDTAAGVCNNVNIKTFVTALLL